TVTEVFNFCWILFIYAKGNFPMISADLVNSYHLLLCALDLVYCNALLCSSHKDLLNPAFKGLPEDFNSKDYKPGPGSLCFIEKLCELHDGLVLEAKGAKEHFWKPFIKKLFERKVLKGKEDTLTGFLEPINFGDSLASLNRVYEKHVLSSGSLDERIFLGEAAREDIGTPGPCLCEGIENQERLTNPLQNSMTASTLKVSTPLTGSQDRQVCAGKQCGYPRFHGNAERGLSAHSADRIQIQTQHGTQRHIQIMPPQHLEDSSGSSTHTPNKSEFSSNITGAGKGVSPSPTSRHDRYSSPPTGTACRRLFVDGNSTPEPAQPVKVAQPSLVSPIPAGQTVVTMATATVTANNGQTVTIPVQGIANESSGITFIPVQVSVMGQSGRALPTLSAQTLTGTLTAQQLTAMPTGTVQNSPSPAKQDRKNPQQGTPTKRAQKTGSLCLFFRKVYHLASVRLRDLCAKLDISADLRRKIWTCFEYSLVHCTDLMVDRHLDQLLMCAIYVMTKVFNLLGADIPPASGESSPVSMRSSSTLPIPQPSSAPSTPTRAPGGPQEQEEERADLIRFYNHVYIKQIKRFALRYSSNSPKNGAEAPPLCPYPSLRIGSPRRVLLSHNHSIYISPHKTSSPISPRDKIFYYVSSSPSNRLREINRMIRTGETPTEKRSIALEEEQQSPAKRLCQENQTALLRRLQDVANDRSSSH
ncbi:retinoblastoma-like protein 2, partial [Sinocyclocheilus grahami]|uniref:retinoblastoma-like protein 2 n=1 Tax=Sinocyclocheilus grahami TaxID=75366 RepID=UPI0007AC828F